MYHLAHIYYGLPVNVQVKSPVVNRFANSDLLSQHYVNQLIGNYLPIFHFPLITNSDTLTNN